MKKDTIIKILAVAGILFAGFLTIQWFGNSGVCGGGCSELWGLPTCAYGLVMFSGILGASLIKRRNLVFAIATLGVLFSLYYAVQELMVCWTCYDLGLPNCAYGLVVFGIVAGLAFPSSKKSKSEKKERKTVSKKSKRKKKR